MIAHAVMAGAFVWIYRQGVAARPYIGQGLRYGLAVALLTAVPTAAPQRIAGRYLVTPSFARVGASSTVFDAVRPFFD